MAPDGLWKLCDDVRENIRRQGITNETDRMLLGPPLEPPEERVLKLGVGDTEGHSRAHAYVEELGRARIRRGPTVRSSSSYLLWSRDGNDVP